MPSKAMRRGESSRRLGPLVPLGDDLLVEDAHLLRHEQPHVLHNVSCQLLLGDVLAFYVEPEVLSLQASPVGEVHLEVELHPPVRGGFVAHCSPPSSSQVSGCWASYAVVEVPQVCSPTFGEVDAFSEVQRAKEGPEPYARTPARREVVLWASLAPRQGVSQIAQRPLVLAPLPVTLPLSLLGFFLGPPGLGLLG